ncbi:MAG: SMP-30/gluconolactonase/LRE family protein [Burkholderiaceae bacterium]|nr:SMP-30/gluconolactonase/LRE family protein [Burkholderiaceae bacterium]
MPQASAVLVEPAFSVPARLGESPLWHPTEQCLYYVDIAAHRVMRWHPGDVAPEAFELDGEPGCIAVVADTSGGGLLAAQRNGLWHLDTRTGQRRLLAPPPFDPARQRFNDGKPDALGRMWVGTIDDARQPEAALYRFEAGQFTRMAGGISNSNGLAWSPDQKTLYWADTKGHVIYRLPFDLALGSIASDESARQVYAQFEPRQALASPGLYGGRPDGAAVDSQGCYWVAMYEGARLLRLSPAGEVLQVVPLPVQCPTMPCLGDADLRTLYVTTACEGRSAEELASQPWAGCVLKFRVDVPGLPARQVRL